jgi:hypothetical protein
MTKTIRYIHIPYCRNCSEIERLVSDSWIAIRENTDTNNLRFCYMKLIVWVVRDVKQNPLHNIEMNKTGGV